MFSLIKSVALFVLAVLFVAMPSKSSAAPLVSGPTITYDLAYSGSGPNLMASGFGSFTVNFMDEAGQTVSGTVTAFTFALLFSGTGAPFGSSTFSYGLSNLNSDVVVADGSAANPNLEYFALSSSDKPAQFVLAFPASDTSSTYPAPYTTSGSVVLTAPPSTAPEPSTLGLTAGMGILLVIAGLLRRRAAAVESSRAAIQPVRLRRVVLPGLFVLALLVVPRMRADTVSYSAAFGLDNNQVPMYAPYSLAVSLPQFNSALGQLTGVQLGFSNVTYFTGPAIEGETSIAAQTVNYSDVTVNQSITLTAPDGTQLTNTLTEGPATGSVSEATPQDFTLYPTFTSSQADSGGAVPNTDFGAFEGPGNLSLTAAAGVPGVSGTVSFSPNPPLGAAGGSIGILGEVPTNEVFGDASITYTYTPSTTTPEPGTAPLLLLALPAVCLLKKARRLALLVCGLTLSFCAPKVFAGAVNIVQNPGFEEDYTDWYFGSPISSIGAGQAHSGNFFVQLFSEVEQGLVTNPVATYSLSFWAANFGGGQMSIYWNGDLVQSVSDPGGCHVANCAPLVWNEFSYSDLLATSSLTPLELTGSFVGLDDFTVIQTLPAPATSVPEPRSLVALALGLSICRVACLPWWRRLFRLRSEALLRLSSLAIALVALSCQATFAGQLLYSFQNSQAYMANNAFWAFTSNGLTASQSIADNQCTASSDCWSSGAVQSQQEGTSFNWTGLESSAGQSLGNTGIYVPGATNLSQPGTYQYIYGDELGTGVLTISPVSELLYSFQDEGDDRFSWSFTAPQLTSSQDIPSGQCQDCVNVEFLAEGAQFTFNTLQVNSGQAVDGAAYVAHAASFTQPGTYVYGYENDFRGDSGTGVLTVSLVTVPEPPLFGVLAVGFALLLGGAGVSAYVPPISNQPAGCHPTPQLVSQSTHSKRKGIRT